MDPFSIGATVATIVALIGKSVTSLNSLRITCSTAQLKLELLAGQLQTVEAALRQVQFFINDSLALEAQHQQLAADLARALHFCRLLVQHIDNHISKIWDPACSIKVENKVRLMIEDEAIEQYLTWLHHQLSALTVCLTVFNCRSPKEQKDLLDRAESRTIFEQAEDDATSLLAIDKSSTTLVSRRVSILSTQSQLSKVFAFDELLMRHKAYQRSFRFMLRRSSTPISTNTSPTSATPRSLSALEMRDSSERSARLDSMLKADAQKKSRDLKILVLGNKRSTIARQLRSSLGPLFQDEDLDQSRKAIVQFVTSALLNMIDDIETNGAGFATKQAMRHVSLLKEFSGSAAPDWEASPDVCMAARGLWRNWLVQQSFQQSTQDCDIAYFLKSMDRIMDPKYAPTAPDMIRAPERLTTIRETNLAVDDLNVNLVEVPHGKLGRIIHQFDEVDGCLLSLDLASFDKYNEEDKEHSTFEISLRLFKGICRSGVLSTKPILLVFVNMRTFRQKLKTSPFSLHWPGYTGGSDAAAAMDSILRRCKRAATKDQELFVHVAEDDAEDVSTIQFFKKRVTGLPATAYMTKVLGLQPHPTVKYSDSSLAVFWPRLRSTHTV